MIKHRSQTPLRFPYSVANTKLRLVATALSIVALVSFNSRGADVPSLLTMSQPDWGNIVRQTNGTGRIQLHVTEWPTAKGQLIIPTPFPEITSAIVINGRQRDPAMWVFNLDATRLFMEVPTSAPPNMPGIIELETADKTTQFPDGRIVLSAVDAQVNGNRAKLESHPGNHRIGFWLDASDTVTWNYKPTRWGMYDLEMTYAAQDGAGTELQFEIAGKTLTVARPQTGSWYRYTTLPIGRFYLEKAQPFSVKVSCKTLKGVAVANLKALTLRPAPEGQKITQTAGGTIVLAASNCITHSVTMRYEPATNKNCLGYWINVRDWAEWEFAVVTPGTYEVEVVHGAGNNQGGDILVEVNGQSLPFTTVDTGDIHKHTGLRIGKTTFATPGSYSLALKPQRKKGGAIMDLTQIRLLRVEK